MAFGCCAQTVSETAAIRQTAVKDVDSKRIKAFDMLSDYSSGADPESAGYGGSMLPTRNLLPFVAVDVETDLTDGVLNLRSNLGDLCVSRCSLR